MPPTTSARVEVLSWMRRHEGDELEGDAILFGVADTGQRFDAVETGVLVDVDVATDTRRAAGETSLDRARGTLVNVVGAGGAGIFGEGLAGALKRTRGIGGEAQHACFVEVLVRIEEAGGNQRTRNVDAGAAGACIEERFDGDDASVRSNDDVADGLRAVVMDDGSARERKGLAGCQICERRCCSVSYHSSPPSRYEEN